MSFSKLPPPSNGSRIEKRFLYVNLAFFILMSAVMLVVAVTFMRNITYTVSEDYARLYSARTIGLLNTHLNREVGIMTQASRSRAVTDWFSDEFNEEKRRLAFEEMSSLMGVLYSANLYFGIEGSLNEFSLDQQSTYETFSPYDTLKRDRFDDQWYFECMDSPTPYKLNVDIDKLKGRKLVWLNYRVMAAGKPVGVLCTGLQFDRVIEDLFGAYNARNVRGLVVDELGVIQLDSAISGVGDKLIFNNSETVQEEITDPAFVADVNAHLGNIHGFFTGKEAVRMVELTQGDYSYASIASIAGTNWSVITLYNANSLFTLFDLLPALAVMLILFVIYCLAVTVINRRIIVKPLNLLAQSLSGLEAGDTRALYGMERDDEFGRLSRSISDMKSRLDETNAVLTAAMERAESSSRAKTEFLSNMSHEMRTPLNAVIGMVNIARGSEDREKIRQCLAKIENASVHLVGIINDILDMAKIESGMLELHEREFNFPAVMARTAEVVQYRMAEKLQTFSMVLDEDIPCRLIADEQRLAQVVTNLLSNAEKFTPEGGRIALDARLEGEKDGLYVIKISVTDSGIGISQEKQRKLFQSFAQADSGIARKFGGTGLGLAISRRIVEMMGGRIWLESEEGRGARFSFTITVRPGQGSEEHCFENPSTDSPDPLFDGTCILLAEDVEVNREIVLTLLEPQGIRFLVAENGFQAVDLYAKHHYEIDLIFMDIQMPKMDGYEASRRIRAMDLPNAASVPIIAMTANAFKEDVEACRASGMNSHVGKPIDFGQVAALLKKYLPSAS